MNNTDKKQLIAETYLRILAQTPDGKITVTQLIEECGLSRQTFYYHFKDILDVVEYIIRDILTGIMKETYDSDDPAESIRRFIEAVDENRSLIRKLENTPRSRDIEKCVADTIMEISEGIIESKSSMTDRHNLIEMRFALSMYANGFKGFVLDKIEKNEPLDADMLADLLYRFITGEINLFSI